MDSSKTPTRVLSTLLIFPLERQLFTSNGEHHCLVSNYSIARQFAFCLSAVLELNFEKVAPPPEVTPIFNLMS